MLIGVAIEVGVVALMMQNRDAQKHERGTAIAHHEC